MTAEQIRKRLEQLEAAKEQALAEANLIVGAIRECRFWLEQVAEPPVIAEVTPEQLQAAIEEP